ncbi:MAG: DUF4132 domain-containing protein, partial [Chloroflexi bacterium]|nr:DUF4132 domain-containing protein [Chloroflexota bacterium]
IGTDTAIMQINGIAQKIPFKALKAAAAACLEGIAQDRGLTRAELEDRIVPDCDLDERGSRIFDFGPRQFQFVLGPGMKPLVRDSDGRVKPDLPKPNSKDDPALAAAAIETWKLLKKQVAGVAKIQADRLEQAMVTGRRWSEDEFESLLVHHPLMTNLVRILVWGAWNAEGTLTGTFRVTEDLTYANASDDTYSLPDGSSVGIVHPLQVSETERAAWGEIFGDYELVPPFPQMGRAIHALTSEERIGTDITRFKDIAIPAASVVYGLDKRDWMRGLPGDSGWFNEHTKPFHGANVTAVITYEEGVGAGYITEAEAQKLTAAFFLPGIYLPQEYWPDHKDRLPLAEIDPVVLSEVLADLALIASKGTPA